ncbi:MAG: P-type conjugative transfer protein TrbL [Gammaproteobacteria bacterium]|nr:P-type conjugative transfer protein TrbL [Gammaproteobacteria bacterium]
MDFNTLTTTLSNFLAIFSLGYSNLWGSTLWLFVTLLAMEIVLFGIYYAFGAKNFVDAFWKVIFIGFWWWVVNAFPALTTMMLNSFVAWGNTAGGGGPVNILDPSAIAAQGMAAAEPITLAMENAGSLQVGRKLLLALLWLVVLLIFFIIAIQIFITVLEFYLVVALSSILLPFALLNKTKFLAEKAIGGVISFGIKLMVLAFLMTVAQPILALAVLPADPSYNQIMALVLTVGALGILVWNVPGIAAGMLAGSPSLTAGTAVQAAAIGAVGGGAAVAGGLAATRAAAALGGSAARGAANLGGGVRAGAALSSTFQTGGTGARVAGGVAGGIRGGASALTQSIRGGVSRLTSGATTGLKSSYQSGGRAALGLPSRTSTTAATSGSTARPSWAASAAKRAVTMAHMAGEARPGGSGPSITL